MQSFYGKAGAHPELLFPDPPSSPIAGRGDGGEGEPTDLAVLRRPWGFRLGEIRVPLFVWHGLQDVDATPQMGRYIVSNIPNCRENFIENEGHLLLFNHWHDILSQLAPEQP